MVRIFREVWNNPFQRFLVIAAALTAARIISLIFSQADLGADEAQYWFWSKTPAFGYFSKPPVIAWAIGFTTALFGDNEWAVRFSAPIFHMGAGIFLSALAQRLYDSRIAFWTGLAWLTLPGITFSATLITTDAPLMLFWSGALYAFFRLLHPKENEENSPLWAVILGAAIGFGFLSKYAMLYFIFGAGIALSLSEEMRRQLRLREIALVLTVSMAIITPNILWNTANDFQTVSHTVANANWNGPLFHPFELLEFLGAQFGVFGLLPMLALCWGLVTLGRRLSIAGAGRQIDLALLAFILPPLIIVSIQALVSRAHANWAAAAYPAAVILVTAWAFRARLGWLAKASTAFHSTIAIIFMIGYANFAIADSFGLSNALKRLRGWEELGETTSRAAVGYDAILSDDRELMSELLYYTRNGAPPIVAWDANAYTDNHYEAFKAFDPDRHQRLLYVTKYGDALLIGDRFKTVTLVGQSVVDLKRNKTRTLYFFEVSGYGQP